MNRILFLFIVFLCCKGKKDDFTSNETKLDKKTDIALEQGYTGKIDQKGSFVVYNKEFFYFINKDKKISNEKLFFQFKNVNNSVVLMDFYIADFLINDSLLFKYNNFSVIHTNFIQNSWLSLRISEIKNDKDSLAKSICKRDIIAEDVYNIKVKNKNQLINKKSDNTISTLFLSDLKKGKFFKIIEGFYILLVDDCIYMISKKELINEKVMLHFVREDFSFLNLDFYFQNKEIQKDLEYPFNKLKIVKVETPKINNYTRIRVGQFNNERNIWSKEIELKDIYENELLQYNDEFNEKLKMND